MSRAIHGPVEVSAPNSLPLEGSAPASASALGLAGHDFIQVSGLTGMATVSPVSQSPSVATADPCSEIWMALTKHYGKAWLDAHQ
ncbi:hypothetical protein JVT61DRAFT_3330 [Boletus reticuloceps]|uniref:Uncharacterized protein n=1 Tax=Boletus reticuloceps TaxID=495285 RepID=A0A8I3A7V9_9AGAM|nr:hypothetical protein JVT61DRAFT_3330 [Boletus reticuloceps]